MKKKSHLSLSPMNFPFCIITLFFFFLQLSSCQNFAEFKGDGILRPDVWGKWSRCVSETNNESIYRTYSLDAANIVMTEKYYSNVACQDQDLVSEDVVYYTYYKYDPNYSLTKVETKRRARSSSVVSEFNSQTECGYSSWELNSYKTITDISNCDSHENNPRLRIENRGDSYLYIEDFPYLSDN